MSPGRVLVVDDRSAVREALSILLGAHGIEVETVSTPRAALAAVRDPAVGVVLQDMNFTRGATSGAEGVQLFRDIRARRADVAVVLMTAWGQLEVAVRLVREGADDYLEKPWDDEALLGRVRTLLKAHGHAAGGLSEAVDAVGLITESPEMLRVLRLVQRVAPSPLPVLVSGPSGVGKRGVAELVHRLSGRSGPWVAIDCGALPEGLVASTLFGAVRGAFTGAVRSRDGVFVEADGGTLLLDEIGNLPLAAQAALLGVLDTGAVRAVGGTGERIVRVRVVASTHLDLREEVAAGRFRHDLLHRLAGLEVEVPPLHARPEDIEALARHFWRRAGRREALEEQAVDALLARDWPGQVRELELAMQRWALLVDGPLRAEHVLEDVGDPEDVGERARILAALDEADGVISRAARSLGLSRPALYRRMRRLGIRVGSVR